MGLLGCATNTEDVFPPAPMRSLASSSHAASSSRAVQDDEEESDDDDDAEEDEEEGAEEEHGEEEEEDDEEEEYDDDDGPPATQTTQREKRNVPKKDWKKFIPISESASYSAQEEGGREAIKEQRGPYIKEGKEAVKLFMLSTTVELVKLLMLAS